MYIQYACVDLCVSAYLDLEKSGCFLFVVGGDCLGRDEKVNY